MSEVDRSAVGRRSKNKGKRYEDKCAKMWSTWLYNDIATLRRFSLLSGGHFKHSAHFGRGKMHNIEYIGDFGNIDDPKSIPFCFESKHQEVFDFKQFLTAEPKWHAIQEHKGSTVIDWWEETVDDASVAKRIPILCVTKNRQPDFIVIDFVFCNQLFQLYGAEFINIPSLRRSFCYTGQHENGSRLRRESSEIVIVEAKKIMALDGKVIVNNLDEIKAEYRRQVYESEEGRESE